MRFFADDRQMISDPRAMRRWKVVVRLRSHQRESIVIQRAILRIGASALAASVEGRGFKGEGYGRGLRERFKGEVYGQNDVLQPYDLPVTRGECVRALGC